VKASQHRVRSLEIASAENMESLRLLEEDKRRWDLQSRLSEEKARKDDDAIQELSERLRVCEKDQRTAEGDLQSYKEKLRASEDAKRGLQDQLRLSEGNVDRLRIVEQERSKLERNLEQEKQISGDYELKLRRLEADNQELQHKYQVLLWETEEEQRLQGDLSRAKNRIQELERNLEQEKQISGDYELTLRRLEADNQELQHEYQIFQRREKEEEQRLEGDLSRARSRIQELEIEKSMLSQERDAAVNNLETYKERQEMHELLGNLQRDAGNAAAS